MFASISQIYVCASLWQSFAVYTPCYKMQIHPYKNIKLTKNEVFFPQKRKKARPFAPVQSPICASLSSIFIRMVRIENQIIGLDNLQHQVKLLQFRQTNFQFNTKTFLKVKSENVAHQI
jgi:hypothetical protein